MFIDKSDAFPPEKHSSLCVPRAGCGAAPPLRSSIAVRHPPLPLFRVPSDPLWPLALLGPPGPLSPSRHFLDPEASLTRKGGGGSCGSQPSLFFSLLSFLTATFLGSTAPRGSTSIFLAAQFCTFFLIPRGGGRWEVSARKAVPPPCISHAEPGSAPRAPNPKRPDGDIGRGPSRCASS